MNMIFVLKSKGYKLFIFFGIERFGSMKKSFWKYIFLVCKVICVFVIIRYFWMVDGNLLKELWKFL